MGDATSLFKVLNRTAKIYERKAGKLGAARVDMARISSLQSGVEGSRNSPGTVPPTKLSLHELAIRKVMRHYAPVGALVNERGDILYLLGRTGRYFEPTPGEAAMNIFRMAREGLRGI